MHKAAYRRSTYRPLSSAFFMLFGKCQKYSAIYMTAIFSLKERLKFIFITMTATTTNPQHHQLFPLAHESVSRQRAWNEILRKFIQIEWLCRFYENIVILPASASRTHINIKWICIKMLDLYVGSSHSLCDASHFSFHLSKEQFPFNLQLLLGMDSGRKLKTFYHSVFERLDLSFHFAETPNIPSHVLILTSVVKRARMCHFREGVERHVPGLPSVIEHPFQT